MTFYRFLVVFLLILPTQVSAKVVNGPTTINPIKPLSMDLLWISGITNTFSEKQGLKKASDCLAKNALDNPQCDLVRYIQAHHDNSTSLAKVFTKQVVYVGERHITDQAKKILSINLKSLKEAGYSTLAMEMWNISSQNFIDQFLNELVAPSVFEKMFHEQWAYDSAPYMDLMTTAKREGFKIIALDIRDQIDKSKKYTFSEELNTRDESMAETLSQYLKSNPKDKIIVFCGKLHAYSHLTTDGLQKSQIEWLSQKTNIRAQSVIVVDSKDTSPLSFSMRALSMTSGTVTMDPELHFTNTLLFTSEL